jgi:hypothetical protein
MPIPELNAGGVLPLGIHDCTLQEIMQRFGIFQKSDQRPRLFAKLKELMEAMKGSGMFEAVLIDGSFVTAKAAPNDIDVVAVLPADHNFEGELSVSQYALVSRPLLRKRFGFDVIVAQRDSELYATYVEFFSRVRDKPGLRKGLLRLGL